MITVTGKTFEHRDLLKSMGGKWNNIDKCWEFFFISSDDHARLKSLVGCIVNGEIRSPRSRPAPVYVEPDEKPRDGRGETVKHGDDLTYFNHFAGKNPTAFYGFSSLSKMVKFIEAIPEHVKEDDRDNRNTGWNPRKSRWAGSDDMEHALRLAKDGWHEGTKLTEKLIECFLIENATNRKTVSSIVGGSVNVGLMLSGNPAHMRIKKKRPKRKTITIFNNSYNSSMIEPSVMKLRAATICALSELMEQNGYSCEIVACGNAYNYRDKPTIQWAVTIKSAGEKANINDLVFSMGHPSFLRRMMFAGNAVEPKLRNDWDGMGRPAPCFNGNNPTTDNEFYFRQARSNDIEGSTIVEKALSMLEMIRPDGFDIELRN